MCFERYKYNIYIIVLQFFFLFNNCLIENFYSGLPTRVIHSKRDVGLVVSHPI